MTGKWRTVNVNGLSVESYYCYSGYARDLVLRFKEGHDRWLAPALMYPLMMRFKINYAGYEIVTAPSHKTHTTERGFLPVAVLLESIYKGGHNDVLIKAEEMRQSEMTKENRTRVKSSIGLNNAEKVRNKRVLIFDDIVTTGNTLRTSYELLANISKRVKVFSLFYNERL